MTIESLIQQEAEKREQFICFYEGWAISFDLLGFIADNRAEYDEWERQENKRLSNE